MKTYSVRRANAPFSWDEFPAADIDCYPWDQNGYRPKAYAKACHTGAALRFRLTAVEREIAAVYTNHGDPVYRDSCLEVFLNPCPDADGRYINFELNANGVLLAGIGEDGRDRVDISARAARRLDIQSFRVPAGEGVRWGVEFTVPFDFLSEFYPKLAVGSPMRGNFFKCGDDAKDPHFGCWNHIAVKEGRETANFHQPEFFGRLIYDA